MAALISSKEIRAAIYCRLSFARDGSEEKVDRQEADGHELASRLKWTVAEEHVYKDNSVSAWKRGRHRKAWDAMIEAIKRGELDAIIVYHGDRLVRQPYDLETLLQLADERQLLLSSVSGTRNLQSPDDRYILRIEVAQACRESDNISRRVTRGWTARAEKGLPVGGGRRSFGFEKDNITRRESEVEVIAEAAGRLLAGQGQRGVVRWMNEVSTTTTGGPWTTKTLRNIMLAPRIAGLIQNQGRLYEAVWKPIIEVEDWEEIKALYAQSAREHGYHGRERLYLLSGLAECSACGHTLGVKPTGGRNRKASRMYTCKNCRKISRNVDHLDAYVVGRVLRRVNEPRFARELFAREGDSGIGRELAALERRRDQTRQQLMKLVDHPELSPEIILRSLDSFEKRITELRARQATDMRQRLLSRVAGIDREAWDALPVDVRAAVVRALYRVVVLPATWRGPGFDPASVRLERITS
ncbi:recombinase family protein [Saccharopolyspora sp. NPDC002376]